MKKLIIFIIIFAIVGLIIGYFLFGKIAGEYINVEILLKIPENSLHAFGRKVTGIKEIQQKTLFSGGVGVIIGIILYFYTKKK